MFFRYDEWLSADVLEVSSMASKPASGNDLFFYRRVSDSKKLVEEVEKYGSLKLWIISLSSPDKEKIDDSQDDQSSFVSTKMTSLPTMSSPSVKSVSHKKPSLKGLSLTSAISKSIVKSPLKSPSLKSTSVKSIVKSRDMKSFFKSSLVKSPSLKREASAETVEKATFMKESSLKESLSSSFPRRSMRFGQYSEMFFESIPSTPLIKRRRVMSTTKIKNNDLFTPMDASPCSLPRASYDMTGLLNLSNDVGPLSRTESNVMNNSFLEGLFKERPPDRYDHLV